MAGKGKGAFDSAELRWASLGPYYAMFPMDFAREVVRAHCPAGGRMLDPFAGRGTSVVAALLEGRSATGIEINPVGWLYGSVKTRPVSQGWLETRLETLRELTKATSLRSVRALPEFYRWCFSDRVSRFLLTCRRELDWRNSRTDATLMALVLNDLHGNAGRAFSNQTRQAKSLAPDYSLRWWKERDMQPPELDPFDLLERKIRWRYAKGVPKGADACMHLGDSGRVLPQLWRENGTFDLLFTSPPYIGVADYHYDQWLRLWMLGGNSLPIHQNDATRRGDFANKELFSHMLRQVFQATAPLLRSSATVYVRTDARKATLETTLSALTEVFPDKLVTQCSRPFHSRTQTHLFGDSNQKPGEVDIVLMSPSKAHRQSDTGAPALSRKRLPEAGASSHCA